MSWIWDEGAIVDFILIIFYIILIFLFVHMFSMFPYYTPNFKNDIVLKCIQPLFKSFAKFLMIVYKTIYSFLVFLFYFYFLFYSKL